MAETRLHRSKRAVYTPVRERYDNSVMLVADTSLKVAKAIFESYRNMGPQRRSAIGIELSDNTRDIAYNAYKSANPTLSREELQIRFLERVLGWKLPQQLKGSKTDRGS